MALELNLLYQRSEDQLSILVTDNTGSGATGYGGSNPAVGDFTTFNITITPADPITYLPTGTPVVVNAYPSLPSSTAGTFTITSLALTGVADQVIHDGVYLFTVAADYSGGAGEGIATATDHAIFYENTECCIQNLIANSAVCDCSDKNKSRKLLLGYVWLSLFQPKVFNGVVGDSYLAACGLWNKAAELLRELNKLCENDCDGC